MSWHRFETEEEMKTASKDYDVYRWMARQHWIYGKKSAFVGPGWYWQETGQQRCPRGCCYDSFIDFTPASTRVEEIKEQMRELAEEIRQAREYDKQ